MKRSVAISLFFIIFITSYSGSETFFNRPISRDKLKLLPVPRDFRNYFLFQSFGENSYITIGDFTGAQRFLTEIVDKNSNNKIDSVVEYYPDSKKMKVKMKPTTEYFQGLEKIKRDIISGSIFRENYSYKMKSIDTLKFKLNDGTDIYPSGEGYSVKFFDPDAKTTIMSEFFFSKKHGKYNLIFKTNYYKLYKLKIIPPVRYSVYCKNSKDPVVAEIVESLIKMVPK